MIILGIQEYISEDEKIGGEIFGSNLIWTQILVEVHGNFGLNYLCTPFIQFVLKKSHHFFFNFAKMKT